MLLLVLLLAACGNANNAPENAAAPAGEETSAPANETSASDGGEASGEGASAKRVFKHALGETVIPAHPERVVTLQYVSQMLSVGVKPIGALDYLLDGQDPAFQGIEEVGSSESVNYEKILSLKPDLIIAADLEQADYDKLSKIAPTVSVPWMGYDVFGHVKVVGDILNRQKEAAAWQAGFDEKIKAAKEQIAGAIGADKTVAIYRIDPKEFYVYGVRNIGFTLYKALDLKRPALVQQEIDKDPNLWAIPISLELLPDYGADYAFVTLLPGEDAEKRFEEIKSSALWKNIPAVKNGHVFQISMDTWLGYTPHDIETQLQEAVKLLTQPQP
ncbi:ABC transporter substrate-binding protein [Paenibacillus sp. MWE-103]|uniref:ABC transporter substrate-binding protein n=2 Tax=Paenibacillus artemisiicola TaxID=1172618 RepID=A0ABS3WDR8_9BACL|nr:ABC transporter substrate-binding protein [Paenibacillus artemisiicola]MBO7746260.1 ABC transporter substrate-binding protein [Paenibacillus artemisiicola]